MGLLKNSNMQNKRKPLTAAKIINRLPLQQQLNSSQAMLIKLIPVWQKWLLESVAKKLISANCQSNTQLSSLQNGKLVICCSNSSTASHIKHQQDSLLTFITQHGFKEINQVVIRIDNQSLPLKHTTTETSSSSDRSTTKTSSNSLDAIYSCQKIVKNELLSKSLNKLADTLKKNNA